MIALTDKQAQHILETLKQCQFVVSHYENKEALMEEIVFAIQLIADNPSYNQPSALKPTTNPNLNQPRKR